jgi:hypothetical protein
MNLKTFVNEINRLSGEILVKDSDYIQSHRIRGEITIEDDDDGNLFEIVKFEMVYLPGCSCPYGIRIITKMVD